MTLTEQIYAQAQIISGGVEAEQLPVLKILCTSTAASLSRRLRDGLTPESCMADFVAASALYALAALADGDDLNRMEYVRAGDVTLRQRSKDSAANCLRTQAEMIIAPYLKDRFSFQGV